MKSFQLFSFPISSYTFSSKFHKHWNNRRPSSFRLLSSEKSPVSVAAKTNSDLELPTNEKNENLLKIRHSSAHIMAMAVQKLFPYVKVTTGPWVESG
jgi:threonyl-tRNA synthetase